MRPARLAWMLFASEAALLGAGVVMAAAAGPGVGEDWGAGPAGVLFPLSLLVYPFVGGLVAGRRGDHPIGWLLLASGMAWALTFGTDGLVRIGAGRSGPALWIGSLAWWVPALGLTATIVLQVFPDGRPLSMRWRRLLWLSSATIVLVFFLVTVSPSFGSDGAAVRNPYDVPMVRPVAQALTPLFVLFPGCIVGSVASVVVRYRRAGTDQRQQIKWLGLAGAGLAVIYGVTIALTFATEGPDGVPLPVAVMQTLTLLSYGAIPAAVGFAVLRYRLYDIDRIISRTVAYLLVTGLLVGVYLGLVLGLGGIARSLTGSTDVAVAASTLAVAAAFRPVLRRVRARVDHRFNRARYDAARTIEGFAGRLRDEIDIDSLGSELRDVVGKTMRPSSVSLWLRE